MPGPFFGPGSRNTRQSPFGNQAVSATRLIHFYGYRYGSTSTLSPNHEFRALCGEQPPTLTSGWGNVTAVQRPRALDYTIITDWPPITMDVSIRFDCMMTPVINTTLEQDLSALWWMAGRGNRNPGPHAQGNPPIVKVAAWNAQKQSNLIPPDVQGYEWIITNLQYDSSPIRLTREQLDASGLTTVSAGSRGRQDVVVSLMQWIPAINDNPAPSKRFTNSTISYKTTPTMNTVQKLMETYFDRNPAVNASDFKIVQNLPANNKLNLRSYTQALKPNTVVHFPTVWTPAADKPRPKGKKKPPHRDKHG